MKMTHIIWDFDGTLFDSYPTMAAAFRAALLERGVDEPADAIESVMRQSMMRSEERYQARYGLDDAFFARALTVKRAAEAEAMRPFDGAVAICRAIHEGGGKNHLFTHRGGSAITFLDKFGMLPHFSGLITSKQDFARKPSPEAIEYLLREYACGPDDAMMVGDRDIDIQAGINAGVHTCYIMNGTASSAIAEFNADNLSEMRGILGLC